MPSCHFPNTSICFIIGPSTLCICSILCLCASSDYNVTIQCSHLHEMQTIWPISLHHGRQEHHSMGCSTKQWLFVARFLHRWTVRSIQVHNALSHCVGRTLKPFVWCIDFPCRQPIGPSLLFSWYHHGFLFNVRTLCFLASIGSRWIYLTHVLAIVIELSSLLPKPQ